MNYYLLVSVSYCFCLKRFIFSQAISHLRACMVIFPVWVPVLYGLMREAGVLWCVVGVVRGSVGFSALSAALSGCVWSCASGAAALRRSYASALPVWAAPGQRLPSSGCDRQRPHCLPVRQVLNVYECTGMTVAAGTVTLVTHVCSDADRNAHAEGFVQQFFYTYRYFCTPEELLQFLMDKFNSTLGYEWNKSEHWSRKN